MGGISQKEIAALAEALMQAGQATEPIRPLIEQYPEMTLDDAYQVQKAIGQARIGAGARVVGRKIGLTSQAMQRMLGVDTPDYGLIFDDMLLDSNGEIALDALIQPKVEPEIAFVLGAPLEGPGVSAVEVLAATRFCLPALEVIDSRIQDWRISLRDTVADNASSALVVLGRTPLDPRGWDLSLTGMVLRKNGRVVDSAAAAAVMEHPAEAVAWLANCLARYGERLEAGQLIMPGALTAAMAVEPGDHIEAAFDRFGPVAVWVR